MAVTGLGHPSRPRTEKSACSYGGACSPGAGGVWIFGSTVLWVGLGTTVELEEQSFSLQWCWGRGSTYRPGPCIYNPLG